ncbi:hypothetical protein V493_01483, partial [Pseudogymnoascus sp. VKM F-4281 (FW-2241)]
MFSAALAAFLSLLLFCSNPVVASPYVVTSYYEEKVSKYPDYTYDGVYTTSIDEGRTITRIVNVKPTATVFETLSVATTTADYYSDVTVVNVLVPTGVGETISYDYYNRASTTSYRGYYVDLSYTATSDCATRWVYTTSARVSIPPMITPTPTSVSTSLYQYEAFGETSTFLYAFIDPTFLPTSSLSSIQSYNAPYFSTYCSVPSSYETDLVSPGGTSGDSSSSGGSTGCRPARYSDDDYYYSDSFQTTYICADGTRYTKGLSNLSIALIIVFGWLGLFLIIGLVESYIAFNRLATGRQARRGLPIAFAGMFPFLSCFFLCCHLRGFQAKTPAEQETMTAEWKATGFFTKLGRWLKWGFRYKYPTFLGTPPLRRRKWQDKDTPTVVAAPAMTGPMGPMPPPGSMYVVGNPADAAQRGSVYPQTGAPLSGWYAPQPLDANGNPLPGQQQYPYAYPPQAYQPHPQSQTGTTPTPSQDPSQLPDGAPPSLQPGGGGSSPPLPTRPEVAHLSAAGAAGAESRGSP